MSRKTTIRRPARSRHRVKGQRAAAANDAEVMIWQQMYIVSKRWQSDLVFFRVELNFFSKLIDHYLLWLTDNENIGRARKMAAELQRIEKKRGALLDTLNEHSKRLAGLIESPFLHNAQACKDKHAQIEDALALFLKAFRRTKREVFNLAEVVIESEKSKDLLAQILP